MPKAATPTPEEPTVEQAPEPTVEAAPEQAPVVVFEFGQNMICPQCNERARSDLSGNVFCPVDNKNCPRHVGEE